MKRRWVIRSLFVLLILVFTAGWIFVRGKTAFQIRYSGEHSLKFACLDQSVYLIWQGRYFEESPGWCFETDRGSTPGTYENNIRGPFLYEGLDRNFEFAINNHTWHGFGVDNSESGKYVAVPFWFLTLAAAAVFVFVWRKTQAAVTGRAFPVEITAKEELS